MDVPELNTEHQILGSEFCSGYTDSFGNWNNGFYCPQSESKIAIYCCGAPSFKYCCMDRNPNISTVTVLEPIVLGNVTGNNAVIPLIIAITLSILLFITLVSCVVYNYYYSYYTCPCKRKSPSRNTAVSGCRTQNSESGYTSRFGLYENEDGGRNSNSTILDITSSDPSMDNFMQIPPPEIPIPNPSYADYQSGFNYYCYPANYECHENSVPQWNTNNAYYYNSSGSEVIPIPSISNFVHPSSSSFERISVLECQNPTTSESTCINNIPSRKIGDINSSFFLPSSSTSKPNPIHFPQHQEQNQHGPLVSSLENNRRTNKNIERVPNPFVHSTIKNSSTNTPTNKKVVQFELNEEKQQQQRPLLKSSLDFKMPKILSSAPANSQAQLASIVVETHRISL